MENTYEKRKITMRLSNKKLEYIHSVMEEEDINQTEAVELILKEHQIMREKKADTLADSIMQRFFDKYDGMFKKIKYGVHTADINSQVIIEVLNSIVINQDLRHSFITDSIKSDIVNSCQLHVKNRISESKQMKDNKVY